MKTKEQERSKEKEREVEALFPLEEKEANASQKEQVPEAIDYDRFVAFFNSLMPEGGIPHIRVMDEHRRKALRTICRRPNGKENLIKMLQRAAKSDFLNGGGARGWRADVDWLLKPHNLAKVLEGHYDRPPTPAHVLRKQEAEARRIANKLIEEEEREKQRAQRQQEYEKWLRQRPSPADLKKILGKNYLLDQ